MKKRNKEAAGEARPEGGEHLSYFQESRQLSLSILVILPLFVLYQVGTVQSGSTARNIAEVWMIRGLSRLGMPAATVINGLALVALLYALGKLGHRGGICVSFIAAMILESVLYAVLIFKTVVIAAAAVQQNIESMLALNNVPWKSLWLCVGAGVYEELAFRLLLVGGGAFVFRKVFLWGPFLSNMLALIASSLLFSAAHHIGSAGEQFDSFVFIFRTLCGVGLGMIFIARGLGIAVWTHALYNVLVLWTRL